MSYKFYLVNIIAAEEHTYNQWIIKDCNSGIFFKDTEYICSYSLDEARERHACKYPMEKEVEIRFPDNKWRHEDLMAEFHKALNDKETYSNTKKPMS